MGDLFGKKNTSSKQFQVKSIDNGINDGANMLEDALADLNEKGILSITSFNAARVTDLGIIGAI